VVGKRKNILEFDETVIDVTLTGKQIIVNCFVTGGSKESGALFAVFRPHLVHSG
jgi:hypothetical protein